MKATRKDVSSLEVSGAAAFHFSCSSFHLPPKEQEGGRGVGRGGVQLVRKRGRMMLKQAEHLARSPSDLLRPLLLNIQATLHHCQAAAGKGWAEPTPSPPPPSALIASLCVFQLFSFFPRQSHPKLGPRMR